MAWVTKQRCTEITGYTAGMIKSRIQREKWREGSEWAYIDGLQMIDLDALESHAVEIAEAKRTDQPTTARVVKLR